MRALRSRFPLSNLPAPLAVATRLDPLSRGIDGLRGAFSGGGHLGILIAG